MAMGLTVLGVALGAVCALAVLAVVWEGLQKPQPDLPRPAPGRPKPPRPVRGRRGEDTLLTNQAPD